MAPLSGGTSKRGRECHQLEPGSLAKHHAFSNCVSCCRLPTNRLLVLERTSVTIQYRIAREDPASRGPVPRVVLVHGTFAYQPSDESGEGEAWWQKKSAFWSHLEEKLAGHATLESDRQQFHWQNDANSDSARLEAAQLLLDYLDPLENSGTPYHLVGHSHGGSVIWEALKLSFLTRSGGDRAKGASPLPHLMSWTSVGTPFIRKELKPVQWLVSGAFTAFWFGVLALSAFAILAMQGDLIRYVDFLLSLPLALFIDDTSTSPVASNLLGFVVWSFVYLVVSGFIARFDAGRALSRNTRLEKQARSAFGNLWLGIWSDEDEAILSLKAVNHLELDLLGEAPLKRPPWVSRLWWLFVLPARWSARAAKGLFRPLVNVFVTSLLKRKAVGGDQPTPDRFEVSHAPFPLPAETPRVPDKETDEDLRHLSDELLSDNLSQLRRLLERASGSPGNAPSEVVDSGMAETPGLIHTTYFDSPVIQDLVAAHILITQDAEGQGIQARGFDLVRAFKSSIPVVPMPERHWVAATLPRLAFVVAFLFALVPLLVVLARFGMDRSITVQGRVVDSRGTPVQGVAVSSALYGLGGEETDADGNFSVVAKSFPGEGFPGAGVQQKRLPTEGDPRGNQPLVVANLRVRGGHRARGTLTARERAMKRRALSLLPLLLALLLSIEARADMIQISGGVVCEERQAPAPNRLVGFLPDGNIALTNAGGGYTFEVEEADVEGRQLHFFVLGHDCAVAALQNVKFDDTACRLDKEQFEDAQTCAEAFFDLDLADASPTGGGAYRVEQEIELASCEEHDSSYEQIELERRHRARLDGCRATGEETSGFWNSLVSGGTTVASTLLRGARVVLGLELGLCIDEIDNCFVRDVPFELEAKNGSFDFHSLFLGGLSHNQGFNLAPADYLGESVFWNASASALSDNGHVGIRGDRDFDTVTQSSVVLPLGKRWSLSAGYLSLVSLEELELIPSQGTGHQVEVEIRSEASYLAAARRFGDNLALGATVKLVKQVGSRPFEVLGVFDNDTEELLHLVGPDYEEVEEEEVEVDLSASYQARPDILIGLSLLNLGNSRILTIEGEPTRLRTLAVGFRQDLQTPERRNRRAPTGVRKRRRCGGPRGPRESEDKAPPRCQ